MKKLKLFVFALIFAFTLVGCGETTTEQTTVVTTNVTTETTTMTTTEVQEPVINGVADVTLDLDGTIDLLEGVTAEDVQDGDLTASLVVSDDGGFDAAVEGAYTITVSVTDADSNTVTDTFVVTVVGPQEPVLSGVANVTVQMPNTINLLDGITANDLQDGDLTSSIIVTDDGGFDASTLGSYTVTVSVTDADSNTVTETFTVTVADNQIKATQDLNALNIVYTPGENLDLPKWSNNGTYFYYSSTNTRFLQSNGFVINPPVGAGPVDVVLTCRAVNGPSVVTKDFTITLQPNPEVSIVSSGLYDFDGTSTEYVSADKTGIKLFFEQDGTVPYIDIEEFITMVDGVIESSEITFTPVGADGFRLTYQVEYLDWDEVTTITETYEAYFDFTANTVTVNDWDFWGSYIGGTSSDYGSGLVYTGADYVDGTPVTIDLGNYDVDCVMYDDNGDMQYLLPFHIANLLFLGDVYYDAYYNGDMIYGVSILLTPSEEEEALFNQIRTSSLNTEDLEEDLRLASYNYMALVIDYWYGLKNDKDIESAYDIMEAYAEVMITRDDYKFYDKIFEIAYGLDDLHTSHNFPGYYEAPYSLGLSLSDLGSGVQRFYSYLWDIQDRLIAKYGGDPDSDDSSYISENRPTHTLLDNDTIAVVHIDGFTIDTPDEFKAILDALPASVTDVVIDLSYNTGGNLGAVLRMWGYMTEEPFMYHSQNPADGSASTYYIESEYVAYDYNWHVLSSGITFSAANLFTSMAKEMGVPVMGHDSSGGASSIGAIVTPDGSSIIISTNNVLSTRVGDEVNGYEYLSIEHGIEVDYEMVDVTDDAELIAIINQIRANQAA